MRMSGISRDRMGLFKNRGKSFSFVAICNQFLTFVQEDVWSGALLAAKRAGYSPEFFGVTVNLVHEVRPFGISITSDEILN